MPVVLVVLVAGVLLLLAPARPNARDGGTSRASPAPRSRASAGWWLAALLIVFLAFHIYAAWKVYRGEEYEYPIAGDLARGMMTPQV